MSFIKKSLFTLIASLTLFGAVRTASAATTAVTCANRVSVSAVLGIKYKPENLHGGRGPSWLVQNAYLRTGKKKIEIRDTKCKLIGTFGLYATDYPYGARYYQKSGAGSKLSAQQLSTLAKKAGSPSLLVEGPRAVWYIVKDPLQAEGTVFSG